MMLIQGRVVSLPNTRLVSTKLSNTSSAAARLNAVRYARSCTRSGAVISVGTQRYSRLPIGPLGSA